MGAWGYKVAENDDAADFYDSLAGSRDIAKVVEKALKTGCPETVRAAAQFLAAIRKYADNASLFDDHLERAKAALEDLVEDTKWIRSWDEPATIRKELRKELSALKDPVNKQDQSPQERRRTKGAIPDQGWDTWWRIGPE